MSSDIRNVVIIGTGPAGLTAAIYNARANLKPLVIRGTLPGGQLTQTSEIENFPGFENGIDGNQLMETMAKQAERFGAEYMEGEVEKIDGDKPPFTLHVSGETIKANAVIIASGARPRRLGLASEDKFYGRGVSTCATCDGFFYRGKTVAVVGGGDSAMEEATFLTRHADKVYLLHRRQVFRASPIMLERAKKNPKIEMVLDVGIEEVLGDEQGVHGVRLKHLPSGESRELSVHGFFLAIGHIPNTDFVKGKVKMDDEGYILVEPGTTHTNVKGIFSAGDVSDRRYRQAITAAGMGCAAALEVQHYLESLED